MGDVIQVKFGEQPQDFPCLDNSPYLESVEKIIIGDIERCDDSSVAADIESVQSLARFFKSRLRQS